MCVCVCVCVLRKRQHRYWIFSTDKISWNAGFEWVGEREGNWLGQTIDTRYLSSLKTSQILIDIALRILSRQQQSIPCFPHLFVQDTFQFSSVQWLSHVRLFATPWITARQASLSITNSRNSLKLMSIESMMPSNHLILCHPLLLLPPMPPSIRVFKFILQNWCSIEHILGNAFTC